VCVAAASGSVNPLPAAAQPVGTAVSRVSAVSTPYALTASSLPLDLINVASLPLQNAITIATATANLFTIVVTTPNNVYKAIVSGQVDQVPAAIQAGIASEVAAIQTFLTPPDAVSQCFMAVPMWALYELGIVFARLSLRRRAETEASRSTT